MNRDLLILGAPGSGITLLQPTSELITRTYQLEEVNKAFADMLNGEVARGIIHL